MNKETMEEKKLEVVDRLLGFDSRQLQRQMTHGLADWHRRHDEATRNRRLYAATACVMLLLVQACYLLTPSFNYRISNDDLSYAEVVELNYSLLQR